MATVKFFCQGCKAEREEIERIGSGHTSESLYVNKDEDEYGERIECKPLNVDGLIVQRYQCALCGWVIPNVNDEGDLLEWIDSQKLEKRRRKLEMRHEEKHKEAAEKWKFATDMAINEEIANAKDSGKKDDESH
jgi:hypothetical protein